MLIEVFFRSLRPSFEKCIFAYDKAYFEAMRLADTAICRCPISSRSISDVVHLPVAVAAALALAVVAVRSRLFLRWARFGLVARRGRRMQRPFLSRWLGVGGAGIRRERL